MSGVATGIGLLGWLAIGSTAVTVGSSAASFAQAGKSKRAMRDAESEADAMMRTARRRLDVNYMEQLAIKKEPYELQREAMLRLHPLPCTTSGAAGLMRWTFAQPQDVDLPVKRELPAAAHRGA